MISLFIKRPTLAIVLSAFIILTGIISLESMQIRRFPKLEQGVIRVSSSYIGASANTIQSYLSAPLERALASIDGIDYLETNSYDNFCEIKAFLKTNVSTDTVFVNAIQAVSSIKSNLPKEATEPVIAKGIDNSLKMLYASYTSDSLSNADMYDYINRVIIPSIENINGVASIEILGGAPYAMRIWLDKHKLRVVGLSANEVGQKIRLNSLRAPAGKLVSKETSQYLVVDAELESEDEFANMIIGNYNNSPVYLRDVATVELGSESYDFSVVFNDKKGVFIGIDTLPNANPLSVIQEVRSHLYGLAENLPTGLSQDIVYDSTIFIQASIDEVIYTIAEACIIVLLVVFLFLGSLRVMIIPAVAIPLSLLGVLFVLYLFNYSINLLTLLALVLAIGLVVDDAIIVLENIYRYRKQGMSSTAAALTGIKEISFAIIVMTLTLAIVYIPVTFLDGVTGALFREFAVTLAGAVIVSGIVALFISPTMCVFVLKDTKSLESGFALRVDSFIDKLQNRYKNILIKALDAKTMIISFLGFTFIASLILYQFIPKELAPKEDQGIALVNVIAPDTANLQYLEAIDKPIADILKSFPEYRDYFIINSSIAGNTVFAGMVAKPWNERNRTIEALEFDFRKKLNDITRGVAIEFTPNSLPGADSFPVEFVLISTMDHKSLFEIAEKLRLDLLKTKAFPILFTDLNFNKPALNIHIDRKQANLCNVEVAVIADTLANALTSLDAGKFSFEGQSYKVIPQLQNTDRSVPKDLNNIEVRSNTGSLYPLSSFITLEHSVEAMSLPKFNQLNSVTIQGAYFPNLSQSEALAIIKDSVNKIVPKDVKIDTKGQLRSFEKEGSKLIVSFVIALLIIYLLLSAQFNNFIDPLLILVTVPLAVSGALLVQALTCTLQLVPGMKEFAVTNNIYTQLGYLTLIGLISKHGIMMIDFANQMQIKGKTLYDSILNAAIIRLRPILMTTAAMIVGVVPLIIATGPGAVSRLHLGVVLFFGLLIGTIFTLLVLPTVYLCFAKNHNLIDRND